MNPRWLYNYYFWEMARLRWIGISMIFMLHTGLSNDSDPILFHQVDEKPSQNTIIDIIQDSEGFLWVGTRYGLNKYDGRRFTSYFHEPGKSNSLAGNRVNEIDIDKDGNFWMATNKGVSIYNPEARSFSNLSHEIENPNSLSSDFTLSLLIDHKERIWIGTEDGGLNLYDPDSGEFSRFRKNQNDPFGLGSNYITDLLEDNNGNIWVATWDSGLDLLDPTTNRFVHYNASNSSLTSNNIRALEYTSNGIAVGTDDGLYLLNYSTDGEYKLEKLKFPGNQFSNILESATILSLLEDQSGSIWVGTENKGLFSISKDLNDLELFVHSKKADNSVSSNSIWSLYEDNTGIIWIGTFNKGLNKIDPLHRKFKHYSDNPTAESPLSFSVISSFMEDENGLWIGTDGGGLNYLDYESKNVSVYKNDPTRPGSLNGNAVLDLLLSNENELWVASWEGGISILNSGKNTFRRLTHNPEDPNSLRGPDAYIMHKDHQGNIWISLFRSGIDIYDTKTGQITHLNHGGSDGLAVESKKVRCIVEVNPNVFWLGTEGNGIEVITVDDNYRILDKKNFISDPENPLSLSNNDVSAIFPASDGAIWVSTFGGGLNRYNPKTKVFQVIDKSLGLSSNVVHTIQEDQYGDIWVGTANGLCRVKANLEIRKFGLEDGIQDLEFSKGASYLNKNGQLLFGGINGFNVFHPDDIKRNRNIPPVRFTAFSVVNSENQVSPESIENFFNEGSVELEYDQNDFKFDFSVINYSQSNKNKYAYKLENYDANWVEVENGYGITYTNIEPGTYTLRVKGANNDGVWNEEGASVQIVISDPWYLTSFAIGVYILLILAFLIWSRRLIIYRERLKSELQLEHLELKKAQEVSEMKSQFFANISHEFRTPLTLIVGPLKSLLNGTYKGDHKNQFRIMARNADRLLRLINQILDLSKLESGNMGLKASKLDAVKFLKPIAYAFTSYADRQFITYKCSFPEKAIEMYFDGDKLEKIVINLLSNAFKYTPEFGKVNFHVEDKEHSLVISVNDTGVGIPEDQLKYIFDRFYQVNNKHQKGTGIGLALTKELVELHKGEIQVQSEEGLGTTFKIILKKGKAHLTEDEIISTEQTFNTEHLELSDIELQVPQPGFNRDTETIEAENDQSGEDHDLPVILVAEDNEDMRLFISEYLITNFKVIEAVNGKDALESAFENIPDVIVSDIMMPEMNGYELCERVKKDDRTSHIPVILLTAKASGESTEKGFELGADYYVTKPFNPKLLELRIKNILKTRDKIHKQLSSSTELSLEPKNLNIGSKDQDFLNKIMACVEANFSNSMFGIDDLCKELGMSRTKLYRKLKGLIGQSANEFIRSFRLKRAAQLLKKGDLTISEVTYQVGFNDLQYFRYCFKEQYGVNPSEYASSVQ